VCVICETYFTSIICTICLRSLYTIYIKDFMAIIMTARVAAAIYMLSCMSYMSSTWLYRIVLYSC
jgi:hypothetical protein